MGRGRPVFVKNSILQGGLLLRKDVAYRAPIAEEVFELLEHRVNIVALFQEAQTSAQCHFAHYIEGDYVICQLLLEMNG
jgi:hypothetical protein